MKKKKAKKLLNNIVTIQIIKGDITVIDIDRKATLKLWQEIGSVK